MSNLIPTLSSSLRLMDCTLSDSGWLDERTGVVEEVGRPPHIAEPTLYVLLGCLGDAEAPLLVSFRDFSPKASALYESLGAVQKSFLDLFRLDCG